MTSPSPLDLLIGPVSEVETFSKPGTADVTPSDRKKLAGLLKHYGKMAHPFSVCKRDQIKHGLTEEHANRRCAVIKDLIRGTTKWRNREEAEEAKAILATAEAELRHLCEVHGAGQIIEFALAEERPPEPGLPRHAYDVAAVIEDFAPLCAED